MTKVASSNNQNADLQSKLSGIFNPEFTSYTTITSSQCTQPDGPDFPDMATSLCPPTPLSQKFRIKCSPNSLSLTGNPSYIEACKHKLSQKYLPKYSSADDSDDDLFGRLSVRKTLGSQTPVKKSMTNCPGCVCPNCRPQCPSTPLNQKFTFEVVKK